MYHTTIIISHAASFCLALTRCARDTSHVWVWPIFIQLLTRSNERECSDCGCRWRRTYRKDGITKYTQRVSCNTFSREVWTLDLNADNFFSIVHLNCLDLNCSCVRNILYIVVCVQMHISVEDFFTLRCKVISYNKIVATIYRCAPHWSCKISFHVLSLFAFIICCWS